jgi:hypothetical protein
MLCYKRRVKLADGRKVERMDIIEQKYWDMAKIAKEKDVSVKLAAQMLINVGCEYDKALDIFVEVYSK